MNKKVVNELDKPLGLLILVLVSIALFSVSIQSSVLFSNASADTFSTTITAADTTCSFTANVTSNHNATLIPGVYSVVYNDGTNTPYADGIGSTTLTTFCNDTAGYAIYAIGYTNDTAGTTTMVGTTTNQTITTGTATSGNTSNWSMKLTKVADANISYNPDNLTIASDAEGSFSDYHSVPNVYTKVASHTSNTDEIKGSQLTTTYAAYIQPAQAADTYTGQVQYVLVHPFTNDTNSFIVNFDSNGGTGTMNSQKIARNTTTALTTNSFTAPTGLVFKEWNTTADGTGTSYPNQAEVTNLANAGSTITLYAQWWEAPRLYDLVAAMSKGVQTAVQLQEAITVPTSTNRTEDTSNSGVYEYDPTVFGASSDASNEYAIYYYRGVLENSTSTYGSNGSAATYPNYVILQSGDSKAVTDTCWRIVRTTGSGGVKMIYNGKWTNSTCANATTSAQVATSSFNGTSSDNQQIVRIGYTYNNTYATNDAQSGTIAQIFGTNSAPSVNNTRSDIKTYIEDTWYANNMIAYTSILEADAGYCNDRTVYNNSSPYTQQAETANIIIYGTNDMAQLNFGAYIRNNFAFSTNDNRTITLGCQRGAVDLYHYVANSTGIDNELKYPAALLTADEAAFAGNGTETATQGSAYNANSYLRSGAYFWLLSPSRRSSSGNAREFYLSSSGFLNNNSADYARGVRPVISLKFETTTISGSGTATDPWVVTAP